jgi:hypothetical protein
MDRLQGYGGLLAVQNRTRVVDDPDAALDTARRYEAVQNAVDALERNAAPALAIEAMVAEIRHTARRAF